MKAILVAYEVISGSLVRVACPFCRRVHELDTAHRNTSLGGGIRQFAAPCQCPERGRFIALRLLEGEA